MRPTALRSRAQTVVCARAFFVAMIALPVLTMNASHLFGEEPESAPPFVESDEAPLQTVIENWQSADAASSTEKVDLVVESIVPPDVAPADAVDASPELPPATHEPSSPEEVIPPPSEPKLVQIDGAGDDPPETPTELDEADPLTSGLSVRWLVPTDGFGLTDLELGSVDHRPRFSDHVRWNFGIPFGFTFVDEPQALGIPSVLYSPQIESRLVMSLGESGLGADIAVIPGWFSDFDAGKNNGFRVTGHGIATWTVSEELQFALGAMYLGRDDVHVLPAGGVVWAMSPETRFELLMPKPRVTQRVYKNEKHEHILYTGFELFAGNTWAVTRPDDSYDRFTYRDFRYLVGWEYHGSDHVRSLIELGYVFARKLEFRNSPETLHPDGTLLLRLGSLY